MKVCNNLLLFHCQNYLYSRILIGLLISDAKMSAESRLKKLAIQDNDTITTDDDVILFNVKERIMNLVELAANVDGLINMRVDIGTINFFRTFTNYCLIHFSASMNWRYKAYNALIWRFKFMATPDFQELFESRIKNHLYVRRNLYVATHVKTIPSP